MAQKHPRGVGVRTAPRLLLTKRVKPESLVAAPDRLHLLCFPPCPPPRTRGPCPSIVRSLCRGVCASKTHFRSQCVTQW